MRIGGFQKNSLIDYPDKIACVVFTQGCSWQCPNCHNPSLVRPELFRETIPAKRIITYLKRRRKRLDGVVVTGGEPTLQPDLPDFLGQIKELGYLVKLDTNGADPMALQLAIFRRLVDYIAMDVKAPLENYALAAGTRVDTGKIRESISIVMRSGLAHEFRTTVIPGLHTVDELRAVASLVRGAERFVLQEFRSESTLNPAYRGRPAFPRSALDALSGCFAQRVRNFSFRYSPPEPV